MTYTYELTYEDYHEAYLAAAMQNARQNARRARVKAGVFLTAVKILVPGVVTFFVLDWIMSFRKALPRPEAWLEVAPFIGAWLSALCFNWAARKKTYASKWIMLGLECALLFVAASCVYLREQIEPGILPIALLPWALILLWGFNLTRMLTSKATIQRQWEQLSSLHGPRSLTIVDDGIILKDETSDAHIQWRGISDISETKSQILLWEGINFHILPKRAIGGSEAVEVCKLHLENSIKHVKGFQVLAVEPV